MSTQQVIMTGRKEMKQVENTLGRAEKIVEDTIQIGTQASFVSCFATVLKAIIDGC